jgi:hypothetical protein
MLLGCLSLILKKEPTKNYLYTSINVYYYNDDLLANFYQVARSKN